MSKMGSHDPFGYLNTSYGQRKGRELNCQFDSRPLKVGNRPDFVPWRCHATYCWKTFDKGYNFGLDLTSIGGLHTKLWVSKGTGVQILGISQVGVSGQNDIWLLENTIKGTWWLPPSPGHGESCESVFAHGSFVHQKCYDFALTNLLFGLCKSVWITKPFVVHPNSIPKL